MECTYTKLVPNNSVVDGSLTKGQNSFVVYDFVEYAKQFKSSDFDITSLLAVGAYDMLKPTFVASSSSMDFVDTFQNIELPKPESSNS